MWSARRAQSGPPRPQPLVAALGQPHGPSRLRRQANTGWSCAETGSHGETPRTDPQHSRKVADPPPSRILCRSSTMVGGGATEPVVIFSWQGFAMTDRTKRLRVAWISVAVGVAVVAAVTLPGIVVADAAVQATSTARVSAQLSGARPVKPRPTASATPTPTPTPTASPTRVRRQPARPPAMRRWCTAGSSTAPAISAG